MQLREHRQHGQHGQIRRAWRRQAFVAVMATAVSWGVPASLPAGMAVLGAATVMLAASSALAQEPGTAAIVNGAPISVFRLERHFEDYLKEQGRNLGSIRDPRIYKRLKREALLELIDRQLLWEAATAQQVAIAPEQLDAAMARAESAFRGREAFQRRLRAAGFSEPEYRSYLERIMAGQRVLARLVDEEMATRFPPSAAAAREEEFKAIYQRYKSQLDPQGSLGEAGGVQLVAEQVYANERKAAEKQVRERLRAAAKIEYLLAL